MKSKYLILQIDIGPGTQWGGKQTISPIREIFIPSVKKYCQKFNYHYKLIKKSTYENNFGANRNKKLRPSKYDLGDFMR